MKVNSNSAECTTTSDTEIRIGVEYVTEIANKIFYQNIIKIFCQIGKGKYTIN